MEKSHKAKRKCSVENFSKKFKTWDWTKANPRNISLS